MHICKGKNFSIFLAWWFSWYLVLFLSFQPLRHYMRISIHTRKLFAQPFWLWKTLGPVTFSELQIQNLWGKLNTWHLQNKTENLLHLHSESWYLEVSDSLIISQQQYSPPRPHRVLSSPYVPQRGFVGAYLTFMKRNCSLQVPTRSPGKPDSWKTAVTEESPVLCLRQHLNLHRSPFLYGNVVTL